MYKTYLCLPLMSAVSLKKLFPKAKIHLIDSPRKIASLKLNSPETLVKLNLSFASLSPVLIKLEQTFEAKLRKEKMKLILVFEENLKAERWAKNLDSYLVERNNYLPLTRKQKISIEKQPRYFFRHLSENQQLILQQVTQGQFKDYFYEKSEIDYLFKTSLINKQQNRYLLTLPKLKNYIKKHLPELPFHLVTKNSQIFYRGKKITSHFSPLQKKGLIFLLKQSGKIVSRDQLAAHLWGKNFIYSDYALDQFTCRLRKRMKEFNLDHFLLTIKKQGFLLSQGLGKTETFTKGKLTFKPFTPDKKLLKFYFHAFRDPVHRSQLFQFTPRSKSQIEEWVNNLINGPSFDYFFVLINNHPTGHIGLKFINPKENSASIGAFF